MAELPLLLAVDIGTSTVKGVLTDSSPRVVAEYCKSDLERNDNPGRHEHDPESRWWSSFVEAASHLVRRAEGRAGNIACICVSGIWPTFCLADGDGVPLYPAVLYDDTRSNEICRQVSAGVGGMSYGYELVPRALWFKQNLPSVWAKARKIFSTHNYIVFKLTGAYTIDSHTAFALGTVFDEGTFRWKSDLLAEFGIRSELLPSVLSPNSIAGYLKPQVARLLGLKSGIPVVVGAGDTFISILGCGAHDPGDVMMYFGSVGLLVKLTRSVHDVIGATSYAPGDDGVSWPLSLPRSGQQVAWAARLVSSAWNKDAEAVDFVHCDELAADVPPGASGLTFIHNVELGADPISTTIPRAGLLGLFTASTPVHIYRVVLEAFGYAMRHAIESDVAGANSFASVFAAGGGARSSLWRQIVADVLDRSIFYAPTSSGAFGGAVLAGCAVGLLNEESVHQRMLEGYMVTRVDPAGAVKYADSYERYLQLIQRTHLGRGS